MARWNLAFLLGAAALTVVGISLSFSAPPPQGKHENVRLLVDVLEEVQHKYVKDLDKAKQRELVENMINGGLERLDPHSAFMGPEETKQFMDHSKGQFGGIGIKIGLDRGGQIFVESPMVGTPAYEAGVLAQGDVIVKIDGKTTENMPLKKAVEMIKGDAGQKVTLTVYHEGSKQPADIDITREVIQVDSVLGDLRKQDEPKEWDYFIDKDLNIAYLRVTAFTETTTAELTKVVEYLQKQNVKGLVIDLRNNPGGLLRSAVEVSSLFLPDGKRVVSTKGRNQTEEPYDVKHRPAAVVGSYPIAILLNRYSASASEIVAAALQDHARAVIVGERSYGKGSVQNLIPMESGASRLKLTTASYWRPSGKNIHRFPDSKEEDEWGVRPNKGYDVKLTDEERIEYYKWRRERDVVRRPGQPAPKIADNDKAKSGFKDRVLDKAVDYLRGEIKKGNAAVPVVPDVHEAEAVPAQPPANPTARAALEFRARPEFLGRDELK